MYIDLDYRLFELDEGVKLHIKPMEHGDYLKTIGFMKLLAPGEESVENQNAANFERMEKLFDEKTKNLIANLIPKYCKDLQGLELKIDGEKRTATVDDLVNMHVFIKLCMNIITELFKISSIGEKEAKELKK